MGKEDGETGIDNDYVARGFDNIGANIMGRNMFGPVRGEWADSDWKGWWGDALYRFFVAVEALSGT